MILCFAGRIYFPIWLILLWRWAYTWPADLRIIVWCADKCRNTILVNYVYWRLFIFKMSIKVSDYCRRFCTNDSAIAADASLRRCTGCQLLKLGPRPPYIRRCHRWRHELQAISLLISFDFTGGRWWIHSLYCWRLLIYWIIYLYLYYICRLASYWWCQSFPRNTGMRA